MNFPEELRYTKEHEWIKMDSDDRSSAAMATIGITEYAQGELGDVIFIDIQQGQTVSAGDSFGTIEAVKTVSDLYAPVAGTISEVNTALNDNPEQVNKDPYGAGWLVKMTVSNPKDIDALLSATDYKALIGK
jgi:glycine cleavage system H protein